MDLSLLLTDNPAEPLRIAVPHQAVVADVAALGRARCVMEYAGDPREIVELLHAHPVVGVYVSDMCWAMVTQEGPVIADNEKNKLETGYRFCQWTA